jgi:hypothetical protein
MGGRPSILRTGFAAVIPQAGVEYLCLDLLPRLDTIRIISARGATQYEQDDYFQQGQDACGFVNLIWPTFDTLIWPTPGPTILTCPLQYLIPIFTVLRWKVDLKNEGSSRPAGDLCHSYADYIG